jgi:hypothetical protein
LGKPARASILDFRETISRNEESRFHSMPDLPVGLIVIGLLVEIALVGGMLIWYHSRRKK